MPDPDEVFAILYALTWAALALGLGLSIVGTFYWIDTIKNGRPKRSRHFGGV